MARIGIGTDTGGSHTDAVAFEARDAEAEKGPFSPADAIVEAAIERVGFDAHASCDASLLKVRPEVREMCASGKCHMYGKNWACPPACGSLESFRGLISRRRTCHLVQTVMGLEDEFDGRTMMEAEAIQKKRLLEVAGLLREKGVDALVLAAGTCTVCKRCAYPKACRFPEKRLVSMEAAGLMVNEACEAAGLAYNHGPLTIAYTSAILV